MSLRTMPTFRRGRTYFHETGDGGGLCGVFCTVLIIVGLFVTPMIVYHGEYEYFEVISSLMQLLDEHPIQELTSSARNDDVVHMHAYIEQAVVEDNEMGVSVENALKLRRVTEYCQWEQLQTTSCEECVREVRANDGTRETETYDCNCVTHYDYVKAWRSRRISSLMFDQPGAHHNPYRDPMPSRSFAAPKAEFQSNYLATPVVVGRSILQNARGTFRYIEWNRRGLAPQWSWWKPSTWFKDKATRFEDIHQLQDTHYSVAAMNHQFVYVGDGYFFSPFQESQFAKLVKYVTEYMEGSLFDWQLGDIMPSCTAGDIRFYYKVLDPLAVSVIGQIVAKQPVVRLEAVQTDRKSVGLIHEGIHNVQEMFKAEERDSWWKVVIFRLLLVPWSVGVLLLLSTFCGYNIRGLDMLPGTAAVWYGLTGTFWWIIWGRDISIGSVVCIVASPVMFLWTLRRSDRRSGGFRAVWCMIGRWARVPPSWRVEDSYGKAKCKERVEHSFDKKNE